MRIERNDIGRVFGYGSNWNAAYDMAVALVPQNGVVQFIETEKDIDMLIPTDYVMTGTNTDGVLEWTVNLEIYTGTAADGVFTCSIGGGTPLMFEGTYDADSNFFGTWYDITGGGMSKIGTITGSLLAVSVGIATDETTPQNTQIAVCMTYSKTQKLKL